MTKIRLDLSDDALARAKYELLSFRRNEPQTCACLYANGEPYVIVRAPTQQIYAMSERGEFFTVQLDDVGLIAIDAPPPRPG